MLKLKLIPVFLLASYLVFAQTPTTDMTVGTNTTVISVNSGKQVVEGVKQTGYLSMMKDALKDLEKADKDLKKAMEEAAWMRNLQTAKRLYILIETMTCTYQNINYMATKHGAYRNCFFNFQYEYAMVQLQSAVDMMGILLANGKSMTAGERMSSLNNSIVQFGKAHSALKGISSSLSALGSIKAANTNYLNDLKQISSLRIR